MSKIEIIYLVPKEPETVYLNSEEPVVFEVLEEEKILGIISDFEIACAFAKLKRSYSRGHQKHHLDELLVKDVMKTQVIWTTSTVSVSDAAKLMMKYNIGALPILKDNSIVGIVTRTDLLKTISL